MWWMNDEKKGWNLFKVILGTESQNLTVHMNYRPLKGKYEVDFDTDKKHWVSNF